MADKALEAKNKGNAAFSGGDFPNAVAHFTEAITHDPSNHVLFSNRSAAYASMGKYAEALEDANKTVAIKSDWSKGYGRQGAAYYGLEKFEDAIEAYQNGLKIEPGNALLKKGLDDAENAMSQQGGDMFGQLLQGDIWGKLRANPKTAAYCDQPDFVKLVESIKQKPANLAASLGDPRVASMLGVLLGVNVEAPGNQPSSASSPPPERPKQKEPEAPPPAKAPAQELPEHKKTAAGLKEKGSEAYKKKDFENAKKFYNEAITADPEDISHKTNLAAVYFELGNYDDCIKACEEAISDGRKYYADYKLIARAFARIGNSYAKQEKYAQAIEAYNRSLTENRTADVLAALQKTEKLKKEKEDKDYLDPAKSLEAKEKGNEHFKKHEFPDAVKCYDEAIKRNPTDHVLYSNRAGALTKLMEYPSALKDCDECLRLSPNFIKAYIRKGDIQFASKEYHKSLETYEAGLKIDPQNAELQAGVQKTYLAINAGSSGGGKGADQERLAKAMADPEIQAIFRDPIMQQVLQDMQESPSAAAQHMRNPQISAKIQKLVAAGVVGTR